MPELGDICKGYQIGYKKDNPYIYHACLDCEKQYWTRYYKGNPMFKRCRKCAAQHNDRKMAIKLKRIQNGNQCNLPDPKGTVENPQVDDIRYGREIGIHSQSPYIWLPCPKCGMERWVRFDSASGFCRPCGLKNAKRIGPKSAAWKGGKRIDKNRYTTVWVSPDDFYHSMSKKHENNVAEHRLVMAKHLGRCLFPWEVVHHKNGDKHDNRIENLELSTANAHSKDHSLGYKDGFAKGLIDGRNAQIRILKKRITELETKLEAK